LTFAPMHILGMDGMPRRIYTYPTGMGWDLWNLVATIGAFTIGASVLVFVYNAMSSIRYGKRAGADPWDGRTLEWTIPSPPPDYNFAQIPYVHGREPLWLEKHPETGHGHAMPVPIAGGAPEHGEYAEGEEPTADDLGIHMPDPSYYPLIAALGLALTFAGLLVGHAPPPPSWLSAIGLLCLFYGVYGWIFEPVTGY
ncbi:MAG TPA: cytochrome c oxidase subunit 4, partial [Chloroflexota bacterium]|nr:cytochrome c oxidase subunit 4 [Chloroflexota bacterium]